MLDDIIEAAIDILGDVLEAVLLSKRAKKPKRKDVRQDEPWERRDQAVPWDK